MRKTEVPKAPWYPLDIFLAILIVVGGSAALVAAFFLLTGDENEDSALVLNSAVAATSSLLLLTALVLGPLKYKVGLNSLGLRPPRDWTLAQLGLPFLTLIGILIATALYVQVAEALGLDELKPPDLPFDDYSTAALVITGVLIIGVGPLAEEVFFRGFVFPGLANRFSVPGAVIMSAAFFSLAHGNLALFIPTFVAGILLAWLYLRTGSLASTFLVHGVQNAIAFSVTVWG